MATICNLCLNAPVAQVLVLFTEYLQQSGLTYQQSPGNWPDAEGTRPFGNLEDFPTSLSIRQIGNDAVEIRYNSFHKMRELAGFLSQALSTTVTINQYQSTEGYNYWACHMNGVSRREIENGEGRVLLVSGPPLPFEDEIVLQAPADADDPPYAGFWYEDMDRYNQALGIKVGVYQELDGDWQNFQVRPPVATTLPRQAWWKLW